MKKRVLTLSALLLTAAILFLVSCGDGNKVIWSGVNIGGWLIQECWMCPVKGKSGIEKWTNLETIEVLESRFGAEKTQQLFDSYQDNWFTEEDIKKIASYGCNVIRVPFWYRNFMSDANGTWIENNLDNNPDSNVLTG